MFRKIQTTWQCGCCGAIVLAEERPGSCFACGDGRSTPWPTYQPQPVIYPWPGTTWRDVYSADQEAVHVPTVFVENAG